MQHITFSIIIPTYNRPEQLSNCLTSLTKLNYSRELFDVIVVDDGSLMELSPVIDALAKQLNIRLVKQANAGPAAARNTGAQLARGQFLVFTDDDCCLDSQYLTLLAQQLEKTPNCMIGGRTVNSLVDNLYTATSQLIVDMVYQNYNANPDAALFFASNNMAIPTALFHEMNGFNCNFRTSEDRELCDRWLAQGYTLRYCADAIVYHAHALTLRRFCQQHFHYGRGAYNFHRIRAQRGTGNMLKEVNFHAHWHNWLVKPLKNVNTSNRIRMTTLLLLWQFTNALGFFWQAGLSLLKS